MYLFCMCRNDVCIMVSEPSPEAISVPKQCMLDLPDTGVCITVTEPSPENPTPARAIPPTPPSAHLRRAAFRRASEAPTIIHATLVHRESEEYKLDQNDSWSECLVWSLQRINWLYVLPLPSLIQLGGYQPLWKLSWSNQSSISFKFH